MTHVLRLSVLAASLAALVLLAGGRAEDAHAAFFATDVPGDANCDGFVTVDDALSLARDMADLDSLGPCVGVANIKCEDLRDADDLIAILQYLAGVAINPAQPGRCFVPGVAVPSNPISQGTATIQGTYLFDFDSGMVVPSDGADVQWEITAYAPDPLDASLVATHGARMEQLPGVDYDGLNVVALNTTPFATTSLHGPDGPDNHLAAGTVIGILTDEGNYARVRVITHAYNLEIEWVTYSM